MVQCQPSTDDSGAAWRSVNIPHDFMVEEAFSPSADISQGFLPFATGWYRRRFSLPPSAKGSQSLRLDFDGVMVRSQVWLNGRFLGNHSSGYTPFGFDLAAADVNWSGENVLAVRADASSAAHAEQISWYYDGAGICKMAMLSRSARCPSR